MIVRGYGAKVRNNFARYGAVETSTHADACGLKRACMHHRVYLSRAYVAHTPYLSLGYKFGGINVRGAFTDYIVIVFHAYTYYVHLSVPFILISIYAPFCLYAQPLVSGLSICSCIPRLITEMS